MKLDSVVIENFRNINELNLKLTDFNVLVGENNVGKTNILMAINKILKMNQSPFKVSFSEEDFYFNSNSSRRAEKIVIQLNFIELNENDEAAFVWRGIDIQNQSLNLRLEAEWDDENNDAKVEIFFMIQDDDNYKGEPLKLVDKKYIPFYYIDAYRDIWRETQHSKGDLKQIFKDYNKNFLKPIENQLKSSIKILDTYIKNNGSADPQLLLHLNEILAALKEEEIEISRLNISSIPTDLNDIRESISNVVQKINIQNKLSDLQSMVNDLNGMQKIKESLQENLSLFVPENNSLDLEIGKINESDLLDDTKIYLENAPILKQGSGFQNSFVIALKLSRLLSNITFSEEHILNLIIVIEEPESHMHPHLQRSFMKKLKLKQKDLARIGFDVQFIVTTHSPFILSQAEMDEICLIKKNEDVFDITRLDDDFFDHIDQINQKYIKHFDYIFRIYPEIFLSRGVIIVEGKSEIGGLPEFAKIMDIDLDESGLTIISADGRDTVKPFYLTLKEFILPIAITDNDGFGRDNDLIQDASENYYTTSLKDFEEEIANSVDFSRALKLILKIDNGSASRKIIRDINRNILPTPLSKSQIISGWDTIDLSQLTIVDNTNLDQFLRDNFKTALFWSLFCKELELNEIPDCYQKFISKAKDLMGE